DKVSDNNLETYYNQWLAGLEKLVTDKGLASGSEMSGRKNEWRRAYLNTPHGKPIHLSAAESKPD
ncbi:MAG: nitrile hydratase subunit beta, partial [Rhodospirillaceae bacterium]|nr:nitrile hydratase subunit beta [Rhodospirillaceae bacterium]